MTTAAHQSGAASAHAHAKRFALSHRDTPPRLRKRGDGRSPGSRVVVDVPPSRFPSGNVAHDYRIQLRGQLRLGEEAGDVSPRNPVPHSHAPRRRRASRGPILTAATGDIKKKYDMQCFITQTTLHLVHRTPGENNAIRRSRGVQAPRAGSDEPAGRRSASSASMRKRITLRSMSIMRWRSISGLRTLRSVNPSKSAPMNSTI